MPKAPSNPPGRPPSERTAVVIPVKLTLYQGDDDDLLGFFDAIPPRMRALMVKQALRSGAGSVDLTDLPGDDEMLEALEELIW